MTVALGVNFDDVYDADNHHVISNASCTTNCLGPVAKVLHDTIGIERGLMTTIHAYTADQRLQDAAQGPPPRPRGRGQPRARVDRRAAKAIGLVIPELQGKLHGFAVRAPVPTGSVVDLTVQNVARETSVEEINEAFRSQADTGAFSGILQFTDDPIVSSDIVSRRSRRSSTWLTGARRQPREGRRLVRQRVGLLEPVVELAEKVLVRTLDDRRRGARPRPG